MGNILDVTILDSYSQTHAVVLGRSGCDVAIAKLPFGQELQDLQGFAKRLLAQLSGAGSPKRIQAAELNTFGDNLFQFLIRGDLAGLYGKLPETHVSIKILCNQAAIRGLPWEYIREPKRGCPNNRRTIVRVIPTVGPQLPAPRSRKDIARVLLVAADPIGLRGVDWQQIRDTLQREYGSHMGTLKLDVIESADRNNLVMSLLNADFDIVHFSCHGDIYKGENRLILVNRKGGGPDYISAAELGRVLGGRGTRLVVLSACSTSQPGAVDDFASIAETLIAEGVPAVVANQAPVLNKTVAVFVGQIYRELLSSGNIDKAVTAGRVALSLALKDSPEWGIPTLHRLYGSAQLYD